ncbi:transposon Ty3-G Gag-Pol polyprotein [Trichonephila clavipes]|nr:transposon Ty3-G Gag-Pol polyprotein [Trichonephila clavipes]
MFDSISYDNPTPLAHADTSRDVLPKGEQENGLIRDRIVLEIKDSGLQERLLRENNLSIEKVIEIVRAAEASREEIRNRKYDAATINFVKENQNKPKTQNTAKSVDENTSLESVQHNAVPVIHPPRRVPLALQPKLKSTLFRLEKEVIVSKVNKPTDWVQSLVIEEKPNGNIRLCLDPRDLIKVIKREHYQIPCTDDIISTLEGKKIFPVVDLKDGFWHAPLDEVSSEICAYNTPFRRYKFKKMPFGIVSAPEIFQKRIQKLFGDI